MSALLLRNGRWGEGDGAVVDLFVRDGAVVSITPPGQPDRTLLSAEAVLDIEGARVIQGLRDEHLHLFAMASAARSIACTADTTAETLRRALRVAVPGADGWIRVVGYHDSMAGPLDARAIDGLQAVHPVRVQHRSGMLWMLNSVGLARLGLDGRHGAVPSGVDVDETGQPTGRLWRADEVLRDRARPTMPSLTAVGAELTRLGITTVIDATPDLDAVALAHIEDAVRSGDIRQRVQLLGAPLGWAVASDLVGRLSVGPLKLVLDDRDLPALDELVDRIRAAHDTERSVAVHCVSRPGIYLLLAAWEEAGARIGDRIEHASVLPDDTLPRLALLGVTIVTQPGFLLERGDRYLADVEPGDHDLLYRVASPIAHGVPVRFSSDAPYGPLDPWQGMRAAMSRATRSGAVVAASERVSLKQALDCQSRPLRLGSDADLIVLAAEPGELVLSAAAQPVSMVLIGGERIADAAI